ncbi:MAG: alpha-E domain-containing protein [Myxococcota bacterium]
MLSRVAESIYWMGRYMERAEDVARILDVSLSLHLDLPRGAPEQWRPVLAIGCLEEPFDALGLRPVAEDVIAFMSFRPENPNAILSSLEHARENARGVREVISSEMWEQLNATYLEVREAAASGAWRSEPHRFFQRVKLGSQAFTGVCAATMAHGEGWQFLRLGELLERADQTSRILDVKYHLLLPGGAEDIGSPVDDLQWAAVLRSVGGHEMFCKTFQDGIRPWTVASFLLLDGEFPRSVRYCLRRAEAALRSLGEPASPSGASAASPGKLLGKLRATFDCATTNEIFQDGLHEFCDRLQTQLGAVGDTIHRTYFALDGE